MRRLVYYVAVTADGFIAGEDGRFDFFPTLPETLAALAEEYPETFPAAAREPLGITGGPRHFDTVVMGYRTHLPALEVGWTSAYPHLRQHVVTHRELAEDPTVTVTDDPVATVRALKAEDGALDIWLCGGGDLAGQLVEEIDELHLKVNPMVLGRGVPLLGGRAPAVPLPLELTETRPLPGGVVLQRYRRP